MAKIIQIEGIGYGGPAYAIPLERAGIRTVEDLLRTAGTPAGREALARTTGIESSKILCWVNRADLMRIKGVGPEYTDLLEAAGVDTVKELATRNPVNLAATIIEINREKALVRQRPAIAKVLAWVAEAKTLPPAVTH